MVRKIDLYRGIDLWRGRRKTIKEEKFMAKLSPEVCQT